MTVGYSYQVGGRNEEAIKSHKEAVQTALGTDDNNVKVKAYRYLGNVYAATFEYKNAIECYQKAREISPACLKADQVEVEAYQRIGYKYHETAQHHESIDYYKQALELASNFGYMKREINACFGLGSAFFHIGDLESSRRYFLKALAVSEQVNDNGLKKVAYANLGCAYHKSAMLEDAVKSYHSVQKITHDLKQEKEEAEVCLKLGDIFQELKQCDKTIESYKDALYLGKKMEDEEMKWVVTQRLGKFYLTLASVHSSDCDYDKAIEWYSKALEISGTVHSHHHLHEKALRGLGIARFYKRDTETTMEPIQKAQSFSQKRIDTGKSDSSCNKFELFI